MAGGPCSAAVGELLTGLGEMRRAGIEAGAACEVAAALDRVAAAIGNQALNWAARIA